MSTDLAVRAEREHVVFAALEKATGLPDGSVRMLGLDLTDRPDLTFDEWQQIGQTLGLAAKWTPWAIADWMLWGDSLFGEEAAQGVESTQAERYAIASRFTGLAPDTVRNYVSVGNRVAKSRRRVLELSFRAHEVVAALDPEAQIYWLDRAVEESWGSEDLRTEVKADRERKKALAAGQEPSRSEVLPPEPPADPVKQAARQVLAQAQPTAYGTFEVPPEPLAQLRAALGDEE